MTVLIPANLPTGDIGPLCLYIQGEEHSARYLDKRGGWRAQAESGTPGPLDWRACQRHVAFPLDEMKLAVSEFEVCS